MDNIFTEIHGGAGGVVDIQASDVKTEGTVWRESKVHTQCKKSKFVAGIQTEDLFLDLE